MRQTTQKLLLALYSQDDSPIWLGYDVLGYILPDISSAGRRSLLSQLKTSALIETERWPGETRNRVRSTQQGSAALESIIPAFSSLRTWKGDWTAIHFLTAPRSDHNFRYLRTLLMQTRAVTISRGFYLYPGDLSSEVTTICQNLYRDNIVIVKLGDMVQGDILKLISDTYSLSDVLQTYSGISKEIASLLRKKQPFLDLNNQQKTHICLVFDRFFTALQHDPGITHFYYPQLPDPISLLNDLQSLLV